MISPRRDHEHGEALLRSDHRLVADDARDGGVVEVRVKYDVGSTTPVWSAKSPMTTGRRRLPSAISGRRCAKSSRTRGAALTVTATVVGGGLRVSVVGDDHEAGVAGEAGRRA